MKPLYFRIRALQCVVKARQTCTLVTLALLYMVLSLTKYVSNCKHQSFLFHASIETTPLGLVTGNVDFMHMSSCVCEVSSCVCEVSCVCV